MSALFDPFAALDSPATAGKRKASPIIAIMLVPVLGIAAIVGSMAHKGHMQTREGVRASNSGNTYTLFQDVSPRYDAIRIRMLSQQFRSYQKQQAGPVKSSVADCYNDNAAEITPARLQSSGLPRHL